LLREETEAKAVDAFAASADKKKKLRVEDVTKEQVYKMLAEILESQESMRKHMKTLTQELLAKPMPFEDTYKRIKAVQPEDPLERYGLSMGDFDQLLNKHESDPKVKEGVAKIMNVPDMGKGGDKAAAVPAKRVVEVHTYMLQELDKLVRSFATIKDKESYDMKIVTLAAQAVVGAKVEEKFGLASEDIERAVLDNYSELATNQEFAQVNVKMQQSMSDLMGAPPGA